MNRFMKKFIVNIVNIILILFYRVRVEGLENIPKSGGYIIAANHVHYFDVAVLQTKVKRNISFIAKKELYKIPIIGYITKLYESIPLDRYKSDINAVKHSLKYLKEGKLLGIFPEGTRIVNVKKGKKKYRIRNGAVKLANENNIKIIPVGINSNYKIFGKIYVKIGSPYTVKLKKDIKKYKAYSNASKELMEKIYDLAGVENEYLNS